MDLSTIYSFRSVAICGRYPYRRNDTDTTARRLLEMFSMTNQRSINNLFTKIDGVYSAFDVVELE